MSYCLCDRVDEGMGATARTKNGWRSWGFRHPSLISPPVKGIRWDVAIAIVQVMEWAQQREMEWNAIPRVPVIDGRDCLDKQ